jgi:tripartite-type tricarboxylate transporter receptor subunit TctC
MRQLCRLVLLVSLFALPAAAQSVEDFYRGRTIALTIGLGAGGGYDLYARVMAKHIGRYIPGNPAIVPKNMPGGGGVQAANYLANVAARDGSELGMLAPSVILMPLFGDPAAKFDPRHLSWIGSMNNEVLSCGVWHTTGLTHFEEMYQKEVIFGGSGPAGVTTQHPLVLKNLLGAKAKVITGYAGSKELNLAMQRGEVEGACGLSASSLKTQWREEWHDGRLRVLIQMGSHDHPDLEGVPDIYKFARSDEDLQVLHLLFDQSVIGRVVFAPPAMPRDRLEALRRALAAMLADKDFRADADKAQMEIDPATGPDIESLLQRFFAYPHGIIAKAKAVAGI